MLLTRISYVLIIGVIAVAIAAIAIVLQPDGKILLGGNFPGLAGQGSCIGRLNADGSPDSSFSWKGWADNSVASVALIR